MFLKKFKKDDEILFFLISSLAILISRPLPTMEKEMATHSSILAWKIPWTEEPGGATVHGAAEEPDMI